MTPSTNSYDFESKIRSLSQIGQSDSKPLVDGRQRVRFRPFLKAAETKRKPYFTPQPRPFGVINLQMPCLVNLASDTTR